MNTQDANLANLANWATWGIEAVWIVLIVIGVLMLTSRNDVVKIVGAALLVSFFVLPVSK